MEPRTWPDAAERVLILPSGRRVRGRGLRGTPEIAPDPEFGVYAQGGSLAAAPPWDHRLIRWPDFRAPRDEELAGEALREAWRRSVTERVEVACAGGRGRTGTMLACLAVLDGLAPSAAIAFVRERYDRAAVETVFQRRFVARFARQAGSAAD